MGAMLPLPEEGFDRSVNVNNVNRSAMGDWLEASALFSGESFSKSDVIDVLVEQAVVDLTSDVDATGEQGLAYAIADEGWAELRNRMAASGPSTGYTILEKSVEPTGSWTDDPVRSFLIILSLTTLYPNWAKACRAVGEQGLLFEKVSARACSRIFAGWTIYEAGWSPTGPKTVPQIVQDMVSQLGVQGNPNLGDWVPQSAKDGGLDLMCFRSFPDQREFSPLYAVQCASGANWKSKTHQPNTNSWQIWLSSSFAPSKALIVPFAVDRDEMRLRATEISGPLFDRNRILSVGQGVEGWMGDIRQELIDWCQPRVELLREA
jgi:hypothetical protein